MRTLYFTLTAIAFLFRTHAVAQDVDPPAASVRAALDAVLRSPGIPLALQAACLDRSGNRSLELFPSGIAIWGGETQIEVSVGLRRKFVEALAKGGFAELKPRYGGRTEKKEAALRISCRVEVEAGSVRKSAIQFADGEQSRELAGLAKALLDLGEPLKKSGVTAGSLQDGLAKLLTGKLAPEVLDVRFVRLPEDASTGGSGSILLISRGKVSEQAYSPGREIGVPVSVKYDSIRTAKLLEVLRSQDFAGLPLNMWGGGYTELEVAIFHHRKVVTARPFRGLSSTSLGQVQERFKMILSAFENFRRPGGASGRQ